MNVHEAKPHFSKLLARAAKGEEVAIAKAGRPVARLVPMTAARRMDQVLGIDKGRIWIADDFTDAATRARALLVQAVQELAGDR